MFTVEELTIQPPVPPSDGQWAYEDGEDGYYYIVSGSHWIARVGTESDARLMAASKLLLEALMPCLGPLQHGYRTKNTPYAHTVRSIVLPRASTAIVAATGGLL